MVVVVVLPKHSHAHSQPGAVVPVAWLTGLWAMQAFVLLYLLEVGFILQGS